MNEKPTIKDIRARLETTQGQEYWRSLDELAETPEFKDFLDKEFPRQAAPLESSLDRRDFMKLLGASLAFAGLTSCARPLLPEDKIVPYVQAPEEILPGEPLFFATAMVQNGLAEGVLAESHMGRPTKLEGNPDHPASLGSTAATTQATVLQLYDPDRSQFVTEGGLTRDWSDLTTVMSEALEALDDGAGLAILTEAVSSPTLARQLSDLLEQYPQARWHQYQPGATNHSLQGTRAAFGEPVVPIYDFSAADVILSLDADFTNEGAGRLRYAKEFSRRRRIRRADDDMNRLWQVEPVPTPTGSVADHRLALAPAQIARLAAHVAGRLGADVDEVPLPEGVDPLWVDALVEDLQEHRGSGLVIAGEMMSPVVHALAAAMNAALDNVGTTVRYTRSPLARPEEENVESLRELTDAMRGGDVQMLVVIGANPVYAAPADLDFLGALARVPLSIHLGQYLDETGAACTWHVPQTHYLEAWSDARAFDGTVTILQPLIAPFYGGKSEHELLAALLGEADARGYEIVRSYWQERVEGDFDEFWRRALYQGIVPGTENPTVEVSAQPFDVTFPVEEGETTVLLRPDPSVADGRWSNNGWLQELPKPFTKLTWDNAALMSARMAEELGVRNQDIVTISAGGRGVPAPVWILPGMAPGVVALHLGYGREHAGRIADGIGVNAYLLSSVDTPWDVPATVRPAGGTYQLSDTQTHHALERTGENRHIIRAGTLEEFREHPDHPDFVHPVEHHESDLYPDYQYETYAWGMVVDMTVCTGCSACVTACQAENNIPIVGKDQVRIGREMHWIRVDNYYRGDIDDPEYFHQPMMCQHCEKAPCEPVCPVGATVHDQEGLNVMVYNRCVGTRYCSNNCPYKVRRFNYLQYAELDVSSTELALVNNPDVSVRSRGVMEKCTYCVQRIARARIEANNEGRAIRDGEVVVACQAACPTEAIVFGDINDPDAVVTQVKRSPLNYALLEELNTVPRTTYLARVTNPHPALVDEVGTEGAV